MTWTDSKVRVALVLSLAVGCDLQALTSLDPVTERPADGGRAAPGLDAGSEGDAEGPRAPADGSESDATADASAVAPDGGAEGAPDGEVEEVPDGAAGELDASSGDPAADADAALDGGDMADSDAAVASDDASIDPVEPDPGPVVPDLGPPELADAARAQLIYDLMKKEEYAARWPGFGTTSGAQRPLFVSPSHGTEVSVRENEVSHRATKAWIEAGRPLPLTMPNGSIVAKDVFKEEGGATFYNGTLVMAKIGALPASYEGGWFFFRVGKNPMSGNFEATYANTCAGCHNGRGQKTLWPPDGKPDALKDYDYLFDPFCSDPATPECTGPAW